MRYGQILLFTLILISSGLYAQVRLLRYIPGAFMSDNRHRLEIQNQGSRAVDISDYVIINRDYFVKIPRGTKLQPNEILVFVKRKDGKESNLFELSASSFFVTRNYSLKVGGNYVVLFDAKMQVLDAFYYSQLKTPPFLPDEVFSTFSNGEFVKILVPPSSSRIWGYYPIGDDPAIIFEQYKGEWRLASSAGKTSLPSALAPALAFRDFSVRYYDGIVSLQWTTEFELNAKEIVIERSEDRKRFIEIGKLETKGNQKEFVQYKYPDAQVKNNKLYYYRLRHTDANGQEIRSQVLEINTVSNPGEFVVEIIRNPGSEGMPSIRFSSAFSQKIQMRILDERMRVVMSLYDNYIYAEAQNLIKLNRPLGPGKYFLVSATERRRFWQELIID